MGQWVLRGLGQGQIQPLGSGRPRTGPPHPDQGQAGGELPGQAGSRDQGYGESRAGQMPRRGREKAQRRADQQSSGGGQVEGLLLAWPSWLSWTSKPRVCSQDAGLPPTERQMSL